MAGFKIEGVKKIILIDCNKKEWREPSVKSPDDPILLNYFGPATASANYGFAGFEGEKARRSKKNPNIAVMPTLEWNWERLNKLLKFLETTELSWEFYREAHKMLLQNNKEVVPNDGITEYYIRPLFGIGSQLGMKINSDIRGIALFGTPITNYYPPAIKIYALTDQIRCMPGGTGWIKASSNYIQSMHGQRKAKEKGYFDALFLDETLLNPLKLGQDNPYKKEIDNILRCNIQELAVANVCLIKNDVLYSPIDRDTILPSTTKRHVLEIADKILKIPLVINKPVNLKELIEADEAFATGTAAKITPIIGVGVLNECFQINEEKIGKKTKMIQENLSEIYWGEKDPFKWMTEFKL
jgi:branched-chain amino acid aminotransferase